MTTIIWKTSNIKYKVSISERPYIINQRERFGEWEIDTDFYFAGSYSSWQRGLNEYTNKFIIQYITKKQSFETLNNQTISKIQHKLNQRPRKKLNFKTPKKLFYDNFV